MFPFVFDQLLELDSPLLPLLNATFKYSVWSKRHGFGRFWCGVSLLAVVSSGAELCMFRHYWNLPWLVLHGTYGFGGRFGRLKSSGFVVDLTPGENWCIVAACKSVNIAWDSINSTRLQAAGSALRYASSLRSYRTWLNQGNSYNLEE